jgi:pimeloyl-ACP methyl ester carboxylesterase
LARGLLDEFDVVMPDARGHGDSSTPQSGYRYEDFAGDVVGLIDELGLSAPVLLGHSMGGMTAAVVASQLGTRIRAVILADPTFLSPQRQREVYESDVVEQHRRLLASDRDVALAQARARHPRRTPGLVELVTDARRRTRLETFEVLTPPNPEYHRLVASIQIPILLVIAGQGVVSAETARELQALNPQLHVEQIPDAGHGLQYDQPERFEAIVGSFLSSM